MLMAAVVPQPLRKPAASNKSFHTLVVKTMGITMTAVIL
jgi:hypothetical protein